MNRLPKAAATAVRDYLCDKQERHNRIVLLSKLSVLLNAAIALGKIVMGIFSLSAFLCVSGLYNVGISSARAVAVNGYNNCKKAPDNGTADKHEKEVHLYYFLVGVIILITSLVYIFRVLISGRSSTQYTEFMVVAIACFTVIEIALSIHGIITARRDGEPILEAIKLTSFASSMISLALTQTAILSYTGQDINVYFGMTGMFFGVLSAVTGIYMTIRACRTINKKKLQSLTPTNNQAQKTEELLYAQNF